MYAFLLFVHLPQDRVLQALCYVHVLTTGLGVAGFVLILCMYFPQDWVLQALCYYCTCTYDRTVCCRLCVIILHVLTTGPGVQQSVAGFMLLLYMYLPQDWVLQTLCYVHVLTTGLCAAGFVLLSMNLPQDWVLKTLCYVHVLTTGLCAAGFVLLSMNLPQDWVLKTLCYVHVLTTGLCAAGFVLILYMYLTTGLGAAGFMLLLSMYLQQDWVLQARLALSLLSLLVSPIQLSPPLAGAGLMQSRVRVCVPHPHVTLQVLQVLHLPQFPFTGTTVKTGTDAHKQMRSGKSIQNRKEGLAYFHYISFP